MVNDRGADWLAYLMNSQFIEGFSEDFQQLLSPFAVKRQRVSDIKEFSSAKGVALVITFPTAESRLAGMPKIWRSLRNEIKQNPDIKNYIQVVVFSTWENNFLFGLD